MSRKRSVDGREVPSIIEEIVIYDKPNKPVVPRELYFESSKFNFVKGDIILSIPKNESSAASSNKEINSRSIKTEPSEIEEILEGQTEDEHQMNERESIQNTSDYVVESDDDPSEVEETIENISKEVSKSLSEKQVKKKSVKAVVDVTSKNNDPQKPKASNRKRQSSNTGNKQDINTKKSTNSVLKEVEGEYAFKKPKGRAKKSGTTPQKSKISDFFNKQPKDKDLANEDPTAESVGDEDLESTRSEICINQALEVSENPKSDNSVEVRQKRIRRRPKKYDDNILDEISFKKQKYAEQEVPPVNNDSSIEKLHDKSDSLEDLLDDAEEQVRALNEAEAELQTLVKDVQLPQKKNNTKNTVGKGSTKKAPAKKSKKSDQPKISNMLQPIKKEADEESDSVANVPLDEAFVSDEDSRREWVPEEYVEYRQQHVMKLINKLHKCKFCPCQFSTYYALRKHRALEHNDVGNDVKESNFEESEANAAAPTAEPEETEEMHDSDEESRGEWMPEDYAEYKMKHNMNKSKRSQWYKCKICCSAFTNYYKLSRHRLDHLNKSEPYGCKQCTSRFKDVESLTAHIRLHQGKAAYNCKKCNREFDTREELDEHATVHILKKPPVAVKRFRCEVCGKEFGKLCDIERHTRVHTGEKPVECSICHKRFQQSHNLSKHLLTHLQVKPFQCEICNKKFGRVDVLNRHILTHSMEKPFKCETCDKGFIRQVQLTNHVAKFHPDIELNLIGLDELSLTHVG